MLINKHNEKGAFLKWEHVVSSVLSKKELSSSTCYVNADESRPAHGRQKTGP